MKTFSLNELTIAYQDIGHGDPIIMAHCSSASHREWMPLAKQLKNKHRILLPDFIGYGKSDRWPTDKPFDALADANIISQLIKMAGQPVDIIAHSYGGAMALHAAKQHPEKIKSIHLIEPVSFLLLKLDKRKDEWNEINRLANQVINACEENKQSQAAKIFVQYWAGRVSWWLTPQKVKDDIISSIDKVAKEFSILTNNSVTLDYYKNLNVKVHLYVGEKTRKPTHTVIDVLNKILPDSDITLIPKAGHMSPMTHRQTVNELLLKKMLKYSLSNGRH